LFGKTKLYGKVTIPRSANEKNPGYDFLTHYIYGTFSRSNKSKMYKMFSEI